MRRYLAQILSALLASMLLLSLAGCSAAHSQASGPQKFSYTAWDVFDTVTSVVGYAESQAEWDAQMEALHADLAAYNKLYDIYNSYAGMTNLADINARAGQGPIEADVRILDLLSEAVEENALTGGKLNVAAGAVLRLWHNAREAAELDPSAAALPDADALIEAAAHCDIQNLVIDRTAGTVELRDPAMSLDVGSVGKGYAVEMCARAAQSRGLDSASISVGGNVRAIGTKPDGTAWSTGVENPWESANGQAYVLAVETDDGESVVTSGDYQRYFTVDGVRYAHLIDLNTLYPARYYSSVTVLANDSGRADCLSTGLFCMTMEQGRALVESLDGVEACWLLPDGTAVYSDGFESQMKQ